MFRYFIKIESRNVFRNKFISALKIFGVMFGFAVVFTIGQCIFHELNYDKFQTDASNKFVLTEKSWFDGNYFSPRTPYPLSNFMKENCPEVKSVVSIERLADQGYVKTNDGYIDSGLDEFVFVNEDFFSYFSFKFLMGNPSECLNTLSPAIISSRLAKKYFPEGNAVGKTITMRIKKRLFDFTITGVTEDLPSNTNFKFEWIGSLHHLKSTQREISYISNWKEKCESYVLLEKGTGLDALTDKINTYYKNNTKDESNLGGALKLENIQRLNLTTDVKKRLVVFLSLGALILIVSLINFVLLSTAENVKNLSSKGIAIVSGARRWDVFLKNIVSVLVSVSMALFLALIIVLFSESFLSAIFPYEFNMRGNPKWFGLLVIFTGLFSIILAGSLNNFILNTQKPVDIIKNKFQSGKLGTLVSNSLLTFQLLSFIALVSISIFIGKQLNYMQETDLGFNKDFLISLKIYDDDKKSFPVFKEELLRKVGIKAVSGTTCPPLVNHREFYGKMKIDSIGNQTLLQTEYIQVDKDYIGMMEMSLVAGECFLNADKGFCVVNETFVKDKEIDKPIGYQTELGGTNYTIVGVLKDFHQHSFYEQVNPFVMYLNPERISYALIRVKPSDIQTTISDIKQIAKNILPNTPFNFHFMDDKVEKQYIKERKYSRMVILLTVIAIIISCFGLLGLSYLVAQKRTKEIGIRKVNGAKTTEILALLNKDFVKWVAIAFVIACPIAYYAMSKWLENFAYKTTLSWWIFALAGVLALGIALLTVSWQSWRAATRNPVEALRYE